MIRIALLLILFFSFASKAAAFDIIESVPYNQESLLAEPGLQPVSDITGEEALVFGEDDDDFLFLSEDFLLRSAPSLNPVFSPAEMQAATATVADPAIAESTIIPDTNTADITADIAENNTGDVTENNTGDTNAADITADIRENNTGDALAWGNTTTGETPISETSIATNGETGEDISPTSPPNASESSFELDDFDSLGQEELAAVEKLLEDPCKSLAPPQLLPLSEEPGRQTQLVFLEKLAESNTPIASSSKDVARSFVQSAIPQQRKAFLDQEIADYSENKSECLGAKVESSFAEEQYSLDSAFLQKEGYLIKEHNLAITEGEKTKDAALEANSISYDQAVLVLKEKTAQEILKIEKQKKILQKQFLSPALLIDKLKDDEKATLSRLLLEKEAKDQEAITGFLARKDDLTAEKDSQLQDNIKDYQQETANLAILQQKAEAEVSSDVSAEVTLLQENATTILQNEKSIMRDTAQSSIRYITNSQKIHSQKKGSRRAGKKKPVHLGKKRAWTAEAALSSTRNYSLRDAIVAWAKLEVKYRRAREHGENNPVYTGAGLYGKKPDYNLTTVGFRGGSAAYCAAFARFIWRSAGVNIRGVPRLRVRDMYEWAITHDSWSPYPSKGAIAVWSNLNHVGIVTSEKGKGIVTVEGNIDLEGGGEGVGKNRHKNLGKFKGFILPRG